MVKRAVLVGCNYPNTHLELSGCINDVEDMKELIVEKLGFDESNVQVLTDASGSQVMPTGAHIMAALKKMADEAEAGDILFFHFSGHGTIIPSLEPSQPYREDEAIVPSDLNLITDVDFRHLIQRLKKGTSFTILSDSCHSGGLIDKEKEQIGPSTVRSITPPFYSKARGISLGSIIQSLQSVANALNTGSEIVAGIAPLLNGIFGTDVSLKFRPQRERDLLNLRSLEEDEGILLSACQANETAADVTAGELTGGKPHGAFTYAILQLLNEKYDASSSNKELVMKARKVLKDHGFEQHPCLYCSDENANTTFLGTQLPSGKPKLLVEAAN